MSRRLSPPIVLGFLDVAFASVGIFLIVVASLIVRAQSGGGRQLFDLEIVALSATEIAVRTDDGSIVPLKDAADVIDAIARTYELLDRPANVLIAITPEAINLRFDLDDRLEFASGARGAKGWLVTDVVWRPLPHSTFSEAFDRIDAISATNAEPRTK